MISDDVDPDMAAVLGFTSFGMPEDRKRKLDHQKKDKQKSAATGSNSSQLGTRKASEDSKEEPADSDIRKKHKPEDNPEPAISGTPHQPDDNTKPSQPATAYSLPARPPHSSYGQPSGPREEVKLLSYGGKPITTAELAALRRGVRNEDGGIVYFLPSFLGDPWGQKEPIPQVIDLPRAKNESES